MGNLKNTKRELVSTIEAVKKINDDSKKFSEKSSDKYLSNIPSEDTHTGAKAFQLGNKTNKDTKQDVFGELLKVVEQFMGSDKRAQSSKGSPINSNISVNVGKDAVKSKLKRHAETAMETTVGSIKEILIKHISEGMFVGDGICGTESIFNIDSLNIYPSEFDFLNTLTVDPESATGELIYEPLSPDKGKQKVNRKVYDTFNGNPYTFTSINNNDLFTGTFDIQNQYLTLTGLTQGGGSVKVRDFLLDYYNSMEMPDIDGIIKNSMLLTIQGGEGTNIQFDKAINSINRLMDRLLSICGSSTQSDELKSQTAIDLLEQDIETYFDFDDVEGIDLEDEDSRYRKVLRFRDCGNFEVPINNNHMDDFLYLGNTPGGMSNAVESIITKVGSDASEQSNGLNSVFDFIANLLNNYILNLPKALMMSVFSAKVFLPITVVYKLFKQASPSIVMGVKDLIRKLYKIIYGVVKDLFWLFIRSFWKLIKVDLIAFLSVLVAKIIKNKYKRVLLIITSLIALLRQLLETNINNCADLMSTILSTIKGAISMKTPISVPSVLLMLSQSLPGYSQDRAYLNVIDRLESSGVPTGPLFGEDNDVTTLVKSIIDGHTEEEDTNSFVKIVLNPAVLAGPTGGAVIPPAIISGVGKKF